MNFFSKKLDKTQSLTVDLCDDLDKAIDEFDAAISHKPTILDRSACVVSGFLDDARARRAALLNQRAEIDEELRQTEIAIGGFRAGPDQAG